jgi:hypothetical protein
MIPQNLMYFYHADFERIQSSCFGHFYMCTDETSLVYSLSFLIVPLGLNKTEKTTWNSQFCKPVFLFCKCNWFRSFITDANPLSRKHRLVLNCMYLFTVYNIWPSTIFLKFWSYKKVFEIKAADLNDIRVLWMV